MEFQGDGLPLTSSGLDAAVVELHVGLAELWSVIRVETRGWGFLADRRPHILYERHVFNRLTHGIFRATAPGISDPKAGGYLGGAQEYDRLAEALIFDRKAALSSTSWGIGQVMGFHAEELGFESVEQMVTEMVKSEDRQLGVMAQFIAGEKLHVALGKRDWTRFARGYNGPQFAKNQYDERLRHAYDDLLANGLPDLRLRSAQLRLLYRGFEPGPIDGVMGNVTRNTLRRFQAQEGLAVTGDLDGPTEARLAGTSSSSHRSRSSRSIP
jgi:N-acetylmuramidase/Putative peptidoglycan binding domain